MLYTYTNKYYITIRIENTPIDKNPALDNCFTKGKESVSIFIMIF